jgi:aldose 1-epimerase
MRHTISHTTVDGFDAHVLACAAEHIEATVVPGAGMVVSSLRHRGAELLGQRKGLASYAETGSTMGVPLLHPWANRLEGLRYEAAGRAVELDPARSPLRLDPNGLPIHGLVGGSRHWQVALTTADDTGATLAARLDFAAHEELLAAFPFPHVVEVRMRLSDTQLSIATSVVATGDVPVPIAFGWHPYLRLPDVPREQWRIELPVRRQAVLDERGIPTGETTEPDLASDVLGERVLDHLFPEPDAVSPFVLAGGGRRVCVELGEGYRVAQVYAPASEDVVCFEPMTSWTNALASGRPSLELLAPGARYDATFSITVD